LGALPGLEVLDAGRLGLDPRRLDPTKLVIDVAGLGLSGLETERRLRDLYAIAPEGSDLSSVVCFLTIGDTRFSVEQLVGAFAALCAEARLHGADRGRAWAPPRSSGVAVGPGPQALHPRDGFIAPP